MRAIAPFPGRGSVKPSRVDRPAIPPEYGAGAGDQYVPWAHVEERLVHDRVVWIVTVARGGRPRVRPVDSLFVDGYVWVGGSASTAWMRDLAERPSVAVHLDRVDDVIIIDGDAEVLEAIEPALAERLAAASNAKFPEYGMTADAYRRGAVRIRLRTVVAWTDFAKDPTRFRFAVD
jgi:Pyridoxamine 5'-phosphate oxidase